MGVRYWRVSNHADLSGRGGLFAGGRWHSAGRAVVYLADHPAGALLEVLVHLLAGNSARFPDDYQLLEVGLQRRVGATSANPADLPEDWRSDTSTTRSIGDAWLAGGRTALLHVPSAIVPGAINTLMNPAHADARQLFVAATTRHAFDARFAIAARSPH